MSKKRFDKFSVLVADPSDHMTAIIGAMLRTIGVRTVTDAGDGAKVLLALGRTAFDAIVLDTDLKNIDAVDLVRRIRADEIGVNRSIPVIMMSSVPDAARITAARDAGVTEFLRKPFAASHLETRLISIQDNPRPFITAPAFAGPDRRRRTAGFRGDERRTVTKPVDKAG